MTPTTSNLSGNQLALVILAAGMGSRFGGLKQLEPVGPSGATIMDYSVFDAKRAGFDRIVFIIRRDIEDAFRTTVGSRYERHIPVSYVFQQLDALPQGHSVPEGRTKPWGTGQAVLAAAAEVTGPFAVANADDFYGASSYVALADFLRRADLLDTPNYTMVGYRLRDTMSEGGTVSRGVCHCDGDGWLQSIVETTKIEKDGTNGRFPDASGAMQSLPGETLVSMNLWGFQRRFFDELRDGFTAFLKQSGTTTDKEFYLPFAVQDSMKERGVRVKVLPSKEAWCGVTHRHDLDHVKGYIADLHTRGAYPAELWN
ncbi:MAG: NDP-sugar synthase [Phycisphaerae bacterium]